MNVSLIGQVEMAACMEEWADWGHTMVATGYTVRKRNGHSNKFFFFAPCGEGNIEKKISLEINLV